LISAQGLIELAAEAAKATDRPYGLTYTYRPYGMATATYQACRARNGLDGARLDALHGARRVWDVDAPGLSASDLFERIYG